jgi:protein-tyrosine kinase
MSRVSDAFRRAAEDDIKGISESTKRLSIPTRQPQEFRSTSSNQLSLSHDREQGHNHGPAYRNHPDHRNGVSHSRKTDDGRRAATNVADKASSRSTLRQRIERTFLGRGLGNIEPYPLIALETNSHAAEQYKMLREQICQLTIPHGRRCIAVSSPIKGDGKSTVAANLATSMALHHANQVLLIDADLRSPSIHHYFGVRPSPGLADYLSATDGRELMDYIQTTSVAGLRVLTAGIATSQSTELLASARMKALIQEIAERCPNDHVIVDTSPVLSTSDPLLLSRQLDGLLMVVRAGRTPSDCVAEATRLVGADKIIGFVLNGAELGRSARYYYYYGQQS